VLSITPWGNHDGVNSGLFLIRNCDWAIAFLDEVYRQDQFIHHTWWEQAAIIELLKRDDVRSQFQIYPPLQPQGGFHGYYVAGEWDKAFIHFAGLREPERLRLIENLVRLAELPPELRLNARAGFGALLNRLRLLGEGVEIGVAAGDYSKTILDVWEGQRLHLVDAWRHLPGYQDVCNLSDDEHQKLLRMVPDKLAAHEGRYEIHAKLASEAVSDFDDSTLDFVYLDADNSYEGVLEMLRAWHRKLRPGGVLAGHDFVDGDLPQGKFGVRRAVRQFELEKGLRAAVTAERDWPSWYFIKP
jgi:SAM-dependent methyltransferase